MALLLAMATVTGCGEAGSSLAVRSTTTSASRTTSGQSTFPSCTAAQLTASGGRQGGGFQTAHGDVNLRSIAASDCVLNEVPTAVALIKEDGTALDVQYQPGMVTGQPLLLSPRGVADLIVSWANWCGANPGPLRIRISLPNGHGVIDSPFNGPPDYNYVPGCIQPGQPSTLQFVGYAGDEG